MPVQRRRRRTKAEMEADRSQSYTCDSHSCLFTVIEGLTCNVFVLVSFISSIVVLSDLFIR